MKKFAFINFLLILILVSAGNILPQAEVDQELLDALQNAGVPVEAVVTFEGNSAPTESQVALLNQVGITSGFTFQSLPVAGVLLNLQQVEALASNPEVRSIYFNKQLEYHNYNSTALTGVDKLRSDANITQLNGGMPVSGKGVTVLVHDSGVDGTHEDLKYPDHIIQNALGSTNPHAYDDLLPINYIEGVPNTDNNSGHGSHVAGIVGGTGVRSGGKYEGVAPGADLIGYGSGATLLVLDALGGFDYALTHQFQYDIRVITNSWGSSGEFDPDNPVNVSSKLAYDRGIVVLFSAGNSGPYEWTLTPYAAPWVITVAAGTIYGGIADFSSRGLKDESYTFELNGVSWKYENKPTITAPGESITSTRTQGPVTVLEEDGTIEPAYIPFYCKLSGTSMSCPHVAGIVALILEANPTLNPSEVKQIIEQTATNMPGFEDWEVGAGYVNAYAAVDMAFHSAHNYGTTLNYSKDFNSEALFDIKRNAYVVDFNPVPSLSSQNNEFTFDVPPGLAALEAISNVYGVAGPTGDATGNLVDLGLIAPDGTEYHSDIYVAFSLYFDRNVGVINPMPGEWTLVYSGYKGTSENPISIAVPEEIHGYLKFMKELGYSGLSDIEGNPAETSIKLAVGKRLVDGLSDGTFRPGDPLSRIQLAEYLMSGQAIRQYFPTNGVNSFSDVTSAQLPYAEAVSTRGAALKDRFYSTRSVILSSSNEFNPDASVERYNLAYSLVQSLGLEGEALDANGDEVTVVYNGETIPVEDANEIPSGFEGYVQLAINLNLINVYYSLTQGPFDLQPQIHAHFKPNQVVTRGEFAVIITRTFDEWNSQIAKQNAGNNVSTQPVSYSVEQNYPNPFNPTTQIKYSTAQEGLVSIELFNSIGEKVKTLVNEVKPAGNYSVDFNASGLASGIYLYRITAGNFVQTRKMTLMK